jgi:hypothetical protein
LPVKTKSYEMANRDLKYNGKACYADVGDCMLYFPTGKPDHYKFNTYQKKPLREWFDVLWTGNIWSGSYKQKVKRHGGRHSD